MNNEAMHLCSAQLELCIFHSNNIWSLNILCRSSESLFVGFPFVDDQDTCDIIYDDVQLLAAEALQHKSAPSRQNGPDECQTTV